MLASCCHSFNPSVRKTLFLFFLIIHYLFSKKFCHFCDRHTSVWMIGCGWGAWPVCTHIPVSSGLLLTIFFTISIPLFIYLVMCWFLESATRMQASQVLGLHCGRPAAGTVPNKWERFNKCLVSECMGEQTDSDQIGTYSWFNGESLFTKGAGWRQPQF